METPQLPSIGSKAWAERFATSLGAQRERIDEFLATRQRRMEQAEAFVQREFQRLEQDIKAARDEVDQLREARDALTVQLAETESQLVKAGKQRGESPDGNGCRAADNDLSRRYEMAMEDVREANDKIAELQQQLAKARSSAAKLAQHSHKPGWLDWETEKQRILAALEADADEDDPARKSERLGIEEVLRMTDEIIAVRDREIQELKKRLEERGVTAAAVDESAIKQAINLDAAIQEERNRLQQLQKDWREKLREAEVELSLERAKVARQRAELDEQFRMAKDYLPKPANAAGTEEQAERSVSGRWLAQLGLTAADREPSRR